jgi:hypothetical protein
MIDAMRGDLTDDWCSAITLMCTEQISAEIVRV